VLCDWDVAMPLVPRRELADVALSLGAWERLDISRRVIRAYRAAAVLAESLVPGLLAAFPRRMAAALGVGATLRP